ncbi:type II toxin-antitoxin system HigB family toxin [Pseudomonas sp.]|uniref:type II toxin-antitoxin system HigB family toxin n=1 Tax=Pseudomonas sp. TaxID=306 RepID=UPI002638B305|nr:type II toxin-antitoxin system HigB family toxin [Pseudomonas sp.]
MDKVGGLHVFNIAGNKLRLIAVVCYQMQRLYIRHVLDHREYDQVNGRSNRK